MTKLRVAIAGLGIGRQHLVAFRKLPERYDVVALCEPDVERGTRVAAEFAVSRSVRDLDEVLAFDDVDVVDIPKLPTLASTANYCYNSRLSINFCSIKRIDLHASITPPGKRAVRSRFAPFQAHH